jgi:hypothetical protein
MPTCKSPLKGPSFGNLMTLGALRIRKKTYFNKIKFQLFNPCASPDYLSKRQSQEGYLTGPSFKRPQLRTCSPANHKSHRCRMEAILGELPLGLGHRLFLCIKFMATYKWGRTVMPPAIHCTRWNPIFQWETHSVKNPNEPHTQISFTDAKPFGW